MSQGESYPIPLETHHWFYFNYFFYIVVSSSGGVTFTDREVVNNFSPTNPRPYKFLSLPTYIEFDATDVLHVQC